MFASFFCNNVINAFLFAALPINEMNVAAFERNFTVDFLLTFLLLMCCMLCCFAVYYVDANCYNGKCNFLFAVVF